MGKRREGRELAVQFLCQHEINAQELEAGLALFWPLFTGPFRVSAPVRAFAERLIRGVIAERTQLDEQIQRHADNWDLHRIAMVDRNILRLAIYEMFHCREIPPVVSIDEAVEVAKKFSTRDSGKFVNGILDRIKGELDRPARTAAEVEGGQLPDGAPGR